MSKFQSKFPLKTIIYHHLPTVKLEAATAVVELLMMDVRTTETC